MGYFLFHQGSAGSTFGLNQKVSAIAQWKSGWQTVRSVTQATERQFACPKCHWKCVRRSRRRTRLDLLLALFLLHPFRCRSCRRRYYRLSL
jgi:hypothetical protein